MAKEFPIFGEKPEAEPENIGQTSYLREIKGEFSLLANEAYKIAAELDGISAFLESGEALEADAAEAKNRKEELLKRQKEISANVQKLKDSMRRYKKLESFESGKIN